VIINNIIYIIIIDYFNDYFPCEIIPVSLAQKRKLNLHLGQLLSIPDMLQAKHI